jgi:hypothetical protein
MPILAREKGDPSAPLTPDDKAVKFLAWYLSLRDALFKKHHQSVPVANGYKLFFQGNEEVRAYRDNEEDRTGEDLKAFMKLEARRCPFLEMELSKEGPFFVLAITGQEGTQTWLEEDYGL